MGRGPFEVSLINWVRERSPTCFRDVCCTKNTSFYKHDKTYALWPVSPNEAAFGRNYSQRCHTIKVNRQLQQAMSYLLIVDFPVYCARPPYGCLHQGLQGINDRIH